jgi:hypothetical protein
MNHVFLSYRLESEDHAKAVRTLGEQLKAANVPVELDQFYIEDNPGGPDEGWPKWCEDRAEKSACVLIVCSKGWFDSYRKEGRPGWGLGAAQEAAVFSQQIYDDRGHNARVRLVILDDFDENDIPPRLKRWQIFRPFSRVAELDRMTKWIRQRLTTPVSSASPHKALEKTITELRQREVKEPFGLEARRKGSEVTANDVFISCKNLDEHERETRDSKIAAEAYAFLTGKGLRVFLSTFTLEELGASDYTSAIDSALKSASVLLAIGTSAEHLESNWVKYEWNSFSNAIRSNIKPNGRVFTYIEGMPIEALPWGLQQTQTFVHGKGSLERLYNFISKALHPAGSSLPIRHGTQTNAGTPVAAIATPYEPAKGPEEALYHLYNLASIFRRQVLDRALPKLDSALLERDDNEKQRIIGDISNDLRSLSADAQVHGMELSASFDSSLRKEVMEKLYQEWPKLYGELVGHLKVGVPAAELISQTLHDMEPINQFFLKASIERLNHIENERNFAITRRQK